MVIYVVMLAVLLPVGVAVALSGEPVGSIKYLIIVREPISCNPACTGERETIVLDLFPGEEQREEVVVSNSSDKNLDVMFTPHLEPEGDGVTVEVPNPMFLVPGEGSTTQIYFIRADSRVEAQEYTLILSVERGDYSVEDDE